MLNLQRASAGSGKTYSLARTYLKLLLGIRRENGKGYRLREPAETTDAHSRLLAITFTNKATAEMRRRFINNLAALADPAKCAKADYMKEFTEEFGTNADSVQRIAALSLSSILNHYSDFQVSTIDSFFQQILHSFTYEAELPDNYAVELESEQIIAAALESLIMEARANPDKEEYFWLSEYMNRRRQHGAKWNLAQQGKGSAYSDLFGYLKMIDKETFKQQREALEVYFRSGKSLREVYEDVEQKGKEYVETTYQEAVIAADGMISALESYGYSTENGSPDVQSSLLGRIEKLKNTNPTEYPYSSDLTPLKNLLKGKALKNLDTMEDMELREVEEKMLHRISIWNHAFSYTRMISNAIPVLGVIHHLMEHIREYREANGIVQLSDTNTILNTITEGSDVPFIYEKIGTEIDSFMIDEFQDTSAMQWANMRPLVTQSLSLGHENLIIGDAKQSIYRFRNADSTLITTHVPKEFEGPQLRILGTTPEENANWRSAPEVVRFNNSIFTLLARHLSSTFSDSGIGTTYAGVLQRPVKDKLKGYVCISEGPKITYSADDDEESAEAMQYLGPTISDMIARGYRQKDIAVLVRANSEAQAAVEALVNYNSAHADEPGFTPIDFISDEALLISRAKSVETAVAMLTAIKEETAGSGAKRMANGPQKRDNNGKNKGEECKYSRYTADLETGIHRLRADHPDLSVEQLLDLYLKGETPTAHARQLIEETKSTALPALVENIMALYVPEELRKREAQYICAFQDTVADFCTTFCNDVASFLHWWEAKKTKLTVKAPEDADAVNILTIHKAKGLEWRCVILPECSFSLSVNKSEQAWLEPADPYTEVAPPLLPLGLGVSKSFVDTPLEPAYRKVEAQIQLDTINVAYVAFTRAVDELHVFLKGINEKRGDTNSIAFLLRGFLSSGPETFIAPDSEQSDLFVDADRLEFPAKEAAEKAENDADEEPDSTQQPEKSENLPLLIYGEKPDKEYVVARNEELDKKENEEVKGTDVKTITGYHVNTHAAVPSYVVLDNLKPTDSEGPADLRRLGSVKHAVLEGILPTSDPEAELDRMLRHTLVAGLLAEKEVEPVRAELENALKKPEVRAWFGPDVKVLAERTIFNGNDGETRRPDRVVIDADGNATVIDYKFGKPKKSYKAQVKHYMDLLASTGRYASVAGVVWYVPTGELQWVKE